MDALNYYHYNDYKKFTNYRGMILARPALLGALRYPILYTGETEVSWDTLKKLPGIGPKTAQRIILELKDKIKTEEAIGAETSELEKEENKQEEFEEVIQALQVLGYRRYEINKILPKIKSESLEERIKEALQYLAIAQ